MIGPIPAWAIWAYVDRYGLPEWVVDAIFSIDASWLTAERDKLPSPPAPPSLPGPRARQLQEASHGDRG